MIYNRTYSLSSLSSSLSLTLSISFLTPLLSFRSHSGLYDTRERCAGWHELHINDRRRKNMPLFIYTHTHTPIYTECIFRCPSGCARRQFYVVGDLRLWSRCLGSDNIMTESTGVTTYRQEGHTHTQIDARTDTYCVSYWMARLFVHWPKGSNVIPQEIILTLDTMCIQLWTNEINFKLKLAKRHGRVPPCAAHSK